ncbi:MAG: hypothetical protein BVN29_05565 [Nitrospira sp. ST-bin5]|nr:MAG: hypothetical protein BVN29_05565 [Nitrospira sp. ST-bin5]
MLLLDGVDAPPTTELANALEPGETAAIPGPALGAAAARAVVPLIIVDRPAPAIAGAPDGMGLPGFIPLVPSSIFDCACALGSIADKR